MKNKTNKTLAIGYGNSLREDDGFGVAVAEALEIDAKFDAIVCIQLTPELAETIAKYDRVLFIDANAANPAGVFAVPIDKNYERDNHSLSPQSLMSIANRLYGANAEWLIFSAGAESFGYKEKLTPPMDKAARDLIRFLKAF